jgi:hypothetical protein
MSRFSKVADMSLVAVALVTSGFWGTGNLLKIGARSGNAQAVTLITSSACSALNGHCVFQENCFDTGISSWCAGVGIPACCSG